MAYIFEPEVLQRIVRAHLHLPIDQQFEEVTRTLSEVYGEHIHTEPSWFWSNAGGIMCAASVLHVSPSEYLLFCGTAIGSEGHSGRHRAEIYDVVMNGELWTYEAGQADRTAYLPGDLAGLMRRESNGSKLGPGCWLLEYSRGNIPSLFPFALADAFFSTLDFKDIKATFGISNKLMLKEARLAYRYWKDGHRPAPRLSAIPEPQDSRPASGSEGEASPDPGQAAPPKPRRKTARRRTGNGKSKAAKAAAAAPGDKSAPN